MAFVPQPSRLPRALLMVLAQNAHASAENTTAEAIVGWQAGPDKRGTLMLVYSCVFTIFACTWTVLHLNVPGLEDSAMQKLLRKIKWMGINILFPEFILSKGICDLRLALDELRGFHEYLLEHPEELTWTTSYYVQLPIYPHGGYRKTIETWQWDIQYPPYKKLLYWMLGLKLPLDLPDYKTRPDVERSPSSPKTRASPRSPLPDPMELQELAASGHGVEAAGLQTADAKPHERSISSISSSQESSSRRHQPVSEHNSQALQKPDNNATEADIASSLFSQCEEISQAQDDIEASSEPTGASGLSVAGDNNATARRRQKSNSQGMGSADLYEDLRPLKKRFWTPVHSYYAQMGGLVHLIRYQHSITDIIVLTATKLTSRYVWRIDDRWSHPLKGLFLSEEDINDKSKADWLLKGIAVIQIIWLVLNITVRGITGLPITQLEMATVAFAIIAILTYLVNWWKPKDISQPTILRSDVNRDSRKADSNPSQQVSVRMSKPSSAAEQSEYIGDIPRVPNDLVWMEGNTPLIFIIMAVTSLVFGGLHCLAWNFEFPTRAELTCWRAASLISSILPVIVLSSNLILNYILKVYHSRIEKTLEAFPEEWLEDLIQGPAFLLWDRDVQNALLSMPEGSRNWDQKPSEHIIETTKDAASYPETALVVQIFDEVRFGYKTHQSIRKETLGGLYDDDRVWYLESLRFEVTLTLLKAQSMDEYRDYETFVARKYATSRAATDMPHVTAMDHLVWAYETKDKLEKRISTASTILAALGGIIYALARITIIVLVFTCLRATPEGVY